MYERLVSLYFTQQIIQVKFFYAIQITYIFFVEIVSAISKLQEHTNFSKILVVLNLSYTTLIIIIIIHSQTILLGPLLVLWWRKKFFGSKRQLHLLSDFPHDLYPCYFFIVCRHAFMTKQIPASQCQSDFMTIKKFLHHSSYIGCNMKHLLLHTDFSVALKVAEFHICPLLI